ncbi:hypothetical protein LTR48_009326, partial [Friedmanniomyces endolithicus]
MMTRTVRKESREEVASIAPMCPVKTLQEDAEPMDSDEGLDALYKVIVDLGIERGLRASVISSSAYDLLPAMQCSAISLSRKVKLIDQHLRDPVCQVLALHVP